MTQCVPEQGDTLIFLHVPKTAGTTLNRIIETQYNPLQIYSIPGGLGSHWSMKKLRRASPKRLRKLQVVKGHMEYGFHRYLPQRATYMTILREPVDRIVSSYYYAMSYRHHPLHRIVQSKSLVEFCELAPWVHNLQTKLIGGIPVAEINPRPAVLAAQRGEFVPWHGFAGRHCEQQTLDAAGEHLKNRFSFVGLTEHFNDTLALMQITYGWKISRFLRFRQSSKRPGSSVVPDEVIARITEMNKFDVELYRQGEKMFQSALAQHKDQVSEILARMAAAPEPGRCSATFQEYAAWGRFAVSLVRSAL